MKRRWKWIEGWEGAYAVSNMGDVASKRGKTPRLLAQRPDLDGHQCVTLSRNGQRVSVRVMYLVANAFLPRRLSMTRTYHRDGNKRNNRADNLVHQSERERIGSALARAGRHLMDMDRRIS